VPIMYIMSSKRNVASRATSPWDVDYLLLTRADPLLELGSSGA
jgi:hypothetical protein